MNRLCAATRCDIGFELIEFRFHTGCFVIIGTTLDFNHDITAVADGE